MNYKRRAREKVRKLRVLSMAIIVLSLLLIGGAAYFFLSQKQEQQVDIRGKGVLATPIDFHDFGNVSLRGGLVSTEVPLVNIGEGELSLFFVNTSCGCTSARVINNGEKGPVFGMASKGKVTTSWKTVIPPGQKALLKIFYDPAVHPNFRGPATREVMVFSNSMTNTTNTIRIKVNQVD